jgi:hypothetical protein
VSVCQPPPPPPLPLHRSRKGREREGRRERRKEGRRAKKPGVSPLLKKTMRAQQGMVPREGGGL